MNYNKLIIKLKRNPIFYPLVKVLKVLLWITNWRVRYYKKLMSNVVSGSVRVTIKGIPSPIEMDIRSDITQRVLLTKEYEYDTVEMIKANIPADRDAINVGANVGIHAVLMALLCERIMAIEPMVSSNYYLAENMYQFGNAIIKCVLCTDKIGSYTINYVNGKEEYSSINKTGLLTSSRICNGTTLDLLVNNYGLNPGLILIDTEGSELLVLKGATETITKYKPVIIMEVTDDLLAVEYLQTFGYEVCGKGDSNYLMKYI